MKKLKAGLVVIGAVLLAGCTIPGTNTEIGGGVLPGSNDDAFNGAFKAAIALGTPMKCSYEVDGVEAEGWIKGKQYIGKTQMKGGTVNVLMKGDCMWSWGEGEKTGTTMCFKSTDGSSMWDDAGEGTPGDVSCRPAAITNAKFTPPSNVKFLDMDAMLDGGVSEQDLKDLQEVQTVDFQGFKE